MKAVVLAVFFALCGMGYGRAEPRALSPAGPGIEPGFVGSPEFETQIGEFGAGTAFFIQVEGEKTPLLVTAQHLFGPMGGLKKVVPRDQMADFVQKVRLRDLVKGSIPATKLSPLTIPEPLDAALFRTAPGIKAKPRPLAKENPKPGEPIWLVAALGGAARNQILHRGTVVEVRNDKLQCKFDDGNLNTRGASGAPYVNAAGEVVGLHIGSLKNPGNIVGVAIPVETLRKAIQAARAR